MMVATKIRFYFAVVSLFITAIMTGCSSEEPKSQKVEFKTSASTLNRHLINHTFFDSDFSFSIFTVRSREEPDEELQVWAFMDVMEIPAKGGTYDFETFDSKLLKLSIYEDMPIQKHNAPDYSSYDTLNGEYWAYDALIAKRKGPDAEVSIEDIQNADPKTFGFFENADLTKELDSFTYTFPENHTGKYRLYIMLHNDPWSIIDPVNHREGREDVITYFIQMPD